MSVAGSEEQVFLNIVLKSSLQVLKRSVLLYAANTALAPLVGFVLVLVLSPIFPVSTEPALELFFETYAVGTTAYSVFVFYRMRSRRLTRVGSYSLVAAGLGFFAGSGLFSYAAWRFASVGYWMRQLSQGRGLSCTRDGKSLVVYGEENLACPKCSRLVHVGYDIPKRWALVGVAVIAFAVFFYVLVVAVPLVWSVSVVGFVISLFFANSIGFFIFYLNPQRLMEGRVRLQPS